MSGTFIGHLAPWVLTQATETRDVTYNLNNQIEFTNGVTQTTVQETRRRIKVSGTFIGHLAPWVLTQVIETRDVTYALNSQIEFTNGVTQTRVRERRTDSASSLLDGTSATEHVQYAQNRWTRIKVSGTFIGHSTPLVLTQAIETRDVTYNLNSPGRSGCA